MMSWEDEVEIFKCPYCGERKIITPIGITTSPVLIIYNLDEKYKTFDYSNPYLSVLKSELSYHRIDIRQFRIVNMWYHAPNKRKDCFDWSIQNVVKEAKNKELILLLGAECVQTFTNTNIGKVSGLPVKSFILSAPIILTCPKPNLEGGIGEFRFAISNFIQKLEENNLL